MSSKQEQPEKVYIQSREVEVVIASVAKQSPVGWPSRPLSFPRTRSREARDRLDPGSESGVTNDRQSHVPRGTVPPMRVQSRGTRDCTPRNDRNGEMLPNNWVLT